jgi:serine/threonine-protein kinase
VPFAAQADDQSTVATRAAGPRALARAGQGSPVVTAEDAAHRREVQAARRFVAMGLALAVSVAIAIPFVDVPDTPLRVLLIGFAVGLLGLGKTALALRKPDDYGPTDAAILGLASLLAGSCGIYYFGFYSPAALATTMALFFFGLGKYPGIAWMIYGTTAAIHAVVMICVLAGVIPDEGVVSARGVSVANQVVMIVLLQVVFFLTFYIARGVNESMRSATEELEEAVAEVAHRGALLEEARRELERALEVGGPGRFTEQELGQFRLGVLCGRGAMGDVYEAVHLETGEPAAVKLLHREGRRDPEQLRRFLRESRIASSIQVANVVKVLEVADDDAPIPFLAMELLRGTDLAQLLRKRRRLPADDVLDMLRQVGRGVDAAHRAGVVHRDLKPRNLFRADVGTDRVWKILDFGVSRLVDAGDSLTRGQAVGTPSYMSPEQARGHDVDSRADIFSLGVIAYRSLTGRPAFSGTEVPEILYNVVHATPPPPSSLTDLPAAVDHVLAIAMAKEAKHRFDSALELVEALDGALLGSISSSLRRRADRVTDRYPWGRDVA